MRRGLALLSGLASLACIAGSSAAPDDAADDLVGVWRLREFRLQVQGEAPRDILGPQPKGYLIFTPEGRMMTILTRADRKPATSVDEQAALLQSMVAYSGRYTIESDHYIARPDVTWNEVYAGVEQVRYYRLSGDTLTVTTAPQASALLPGRKVVGTLTYERER